MQKHFANVIFMIVCILSAVALFYTTLTISKFDTFRDRVKETRVTINQDTSYPGGYLFVDTDRPIINNCDATIAAFIHNAEYDIHLDVIFIPKAHAPHHLEEHGNQFIWKIDEVVPPGVYEFEIHVKNDCSAFSSQSVKLYIRDKVTIHEIVENTVKHAI